MNPIQKLKDGESFEEELFEDLDLRGFDFAGKGLFRTTFSNVKLG